MSQVHNADKPAFARPASEAQRSPYAKSAQDGVTKREWLAGLALQGLLAGIDVERTSSSPLDLASFALAHADALLEELGE